MLTVSNLSFGYSRNNLILNNISMTFGRGDICLIAGPNGCGKSTLLKTLLGVVPVHTGGVIAGSVKYENQDITSYEVVHLTGQIGLVLQDPSTQITNLEVLEEAAFGPCNMLLPREIALDIARNALSMVGLGNKADASVFNLSGGELQRLAIASIIALKPKVLILDEPLSNLDPLGVSSVISILTQLKNYVETIIITSHWLDPFLNIATRFILMKQGRIVLDIPSSILFSHQKDLIDAHVEVPDEFKIADLLRSKDLSVQNITGLKSKNDIQPAIDTTPIIRGTSLGFKYPAGPDIINISDISIPAGSKTALLGPNGAGKSTLASIFTGIKKPYRGTLQSRITKPYLITQKPTLGFIENTVKKEIQYGLNISSSRVNESLEEFGLSQYKDVSPFLLSGGEQRRLSLAIAFVHNPDFIIFDEPTAGVDALQLRVFQAALERYSGTALVITHDTRLLHRDLRYSLVLVNGELKYQGPLNDISGSLLVELGFDKVNRTISFSLPFLTKGFPMHPEDLEVCP